MLKRHVSGAPGGPARPRPGAPRAPRGSAPGRPLGRRGEHPALGAVAGDRGGEDRTDVAGAAGEEVFYEDFSSRNDLDGLAPGFIAAILRAAVADRGQSQLPKQLTLHTPSTSRCRNISPLSRSSETFRVR